MPHLSFIFPTALWLLALLPLLWALALLVPRRLPHWRFWGSLVLRTAALIGLVLGLAGAQLVRPVGAVTTVFLLDGSDSVALSQRARAEAFIQQALSQMPRGDQAGLVVFGQRALVERTPSESRSFGHIAETPGGGATNVEDALRLGLALLPNEGHQRLVLLSDGGANAGDTEAAARVAALRGVPIDVLPLSGQADGLDAQISGVELPAAARAGQRLPMRISLESSAATSGRLTIVGPGGALLADQQVQLPAGAQTLEVMLPEAQPAYNRYVVRLDVPNDARPENNAAEAYSFVSGQPRVLLLEGRPGEASSLASALKAAQLDATVMAAAQAPASLADLAAYDAVALVNVPRRALPDRTQAALSAFVHDLGHGLIMVGGDQSFGAGGWRDSPIEAALPVTMDIPTRVRLPPVGIVVLIDVSGSMGAEENGRTKIALAAEGAQRIAALLRDEDELTVVLFDSAPQLVVGPLSGRARDKAIEALSHASAGGGGINIHDGLAEAAKYIRQSDKPIRHLITLTDGDDTVQQEGARELVQQLHDEKISLSSIAIGNGKDVGFLQDIARIGGGRTFLTDQAANLPTILTQEAQAVIQPYVVEQEFVPSRGAPHPILRGFDQAPALRGYVITTPRQTAQVLLATPRGDPLLAAWQYGLGHAIAWTSDLKGHWGGAWVNWNQFPRFAAQLVGWLLPQQEAQNLTFQSSSAGSELVLTAQAQDALGRPQAGLNISARLITTDTVSTEVALREVAAGQYRATVASAEPGAYMVQLTAHDARGQPFGAVTAGAVVPQSAEYRSRGANLALLEQLARGTGGRIEPASTAAFDANGASQGAVQEIGMPLLWLALLLLPFDIGLRRLLFTPEQVAIALRRIGLASRKPQTASSKASPQGTANDKHPTSSAAVGNKTAEARVKAKREPQSSDLDRLREAQDRARRRARGEE